MNNGGYDLEGCVWHQHSNKLLIKIMELWPKNKAVVDIGCGHHFYASVMKLAGYPFVLGYDLVPFNLDVYEADVTEPIKGKHWFHEFDANVLSLEVGEHLPYDKCFGYLDNLASFGGDIIMSWAVPGQAGHGHVNGQPNGWVIQQMKERGYKFDVIFTHQLRESVKDCHCSWFRNTLMYFRPVA